MKRLFYIMSFVAIGMLGACTDYAEDIKNVSDRIDKLEQGRISTIEQQITSINGSIADLEKVDKELDGYIEALQTTAADLQSQINATNEALAALEGDLEGQISASEQKVLNELTAVKTALEGQLATINNTIAALQEKDKELEQRYFDLEQYINDEIAYTEEWVSFTFATLEQYEATQTAISEINALIKSTQESITALEEKLNKKIADDIAAAVADVNADIAAKVTEITNAYTEAITTAKKDITEAYTDAIKTAITASETSMKEWVNGVLAEGYYTKAEIDGKITALETQVAEGDAALQKEIDDLEAALEKAESDLTAAYEKAIKDAVADGGIINAAIAAAVKTAQDNLQAQIDAINGEIEKIKARLDIIEADIASINQQIIAINGSIDDLEKVDAELKGFIESLENTAEGLQNQLDATNTALAALESDLEGQISASEQKVLNELNTVKTALEGQLATINNTIATLQAKDAELDRKIADLKTYVDSKIAATEDWLNATFTTLEQYEEIRADLAEVQQDLAAVKSEMAAIKTAVTELQTRMATVEKDVDSLQTAVAYLQSRIADLEKNFANRIQSLTFMPQYSDGKVAMDYKNRTTQAFFRISPAEIARLITYKNVKAFARYTKDPATRASYNPEFPLSVTSVLGDETGMLEVNIAESDEHQLSTEFWQGKVEPIIYIQITDDYGNNVVSETIPMIPHNYPSNSSDVVIAKFQHYFCDSNGNMAILPLDEFSHIWAVGVTTGEKVCEIFSDITGLNVTAQESYTYSYLSEDGSVELRITGNLTADENAVYATLYVTIPEYVDVDQIKIVSPEYLKQDNADEKIPIII